MRNVSGRHTVGCRARDFRKQNVTRLASLFNFLILLYALSLSLCTRWQARELLKSHAREDVGQCLFGGDGETAGGPVGATTDTDTIRPTG